MISLAFDESQELPAIPGIPFSPEFWGHHTQFPTSVPMNYVWCPRNSRRRLEKEGEARLAAKLYQKITDQLPDTEAAKTAENKGTRVVDHRVDMAQEKLTHAEAFERINNFEEARAEYEGVISRYPETEAARTA